MQRQQNQLQASAAEPSPLAFNLSNHLSQTIFYLTQPLIHFIITVLAPISTGQPGIALEAWGYP